MANKIDWLENLQKAKIERPQDLEKYEILKYKQNLSVEEKNFCIDLWDGIYQNKRNYKTNLSQLENFDLQTIKINFLYFVDEDKKIITNIKTHEKFTYELSKDGNYIKNLKMIEVDEKENKQEYSQSCLSK